jgi:hypothetical protein
MKILVAIKNEETGNWNKVAIVDVTGDRIDMITMTDIKRYLPLDCDVKCIMSAVKMFNSDSAIVDVNFEIEGSEYRISKFY